MKSIVFFCHAYGRGALYRALMHLGAVVPGELTALQWCQLTWWKRIDRLAPGQLLEVGRDAGGNRIYIMWVKKDKELVPRLAHTLAAIAGRQGQIILVDALIHDNWRTNLARCLRRFFGNNYLSHYLFLTGIRQSHHGQYLIPNPTV